MIVHLSPPCSSGEMSILFSLASSASHPILSLVDFTALSVQELPENGTSGLQNPLQTQSIFVP